MARNQMNFRASLRLDSSQFKKGVNEVKSALAGLKSSFLSLAGALGAGLGFSQLISSVKDTAVQLSTAQNVLKNVSKVTKEYKDGVREGSIEINNYAENMAYVRKLAHDYSQDLVSLTDNFAKFHAACDKTNLSLEAQKDIFEALTRAAAYYHMSADQTNDMTLAITQMMSKGKVSSEELRRQLGNSLPGAFNMMAAALGVTTAQLEDMMKKGEVISSEALPKFAAMLNTVTKNADFDSIQLSMNRLKNTWTELVENSGAEGVFNNMVNGANNVLVVIKNNIKSIFDGIKGLVTGIMSFGLFKYLKKQSDSYIADVEEQLKDLPKKYEKATAAAYKAVSGEDLKIHDPGVKNKYAWNTSLLQKMSTDELKTVQAYTDAIVQLDKAQSALGRKDGIAKSLHLDKTDLQNLKELNKEAGYLLAKQGKMEADFVPLGKKIGAAFKGIGMQIKGILSSMGAMAVVSAIIGGLTAIISHVKRIREEWEKINNIYKDYQNDIKKTDSGVAEHEKRLRTNLAILNDTHNTEKARLGALKELNKEMGTSFGKEALDKTKQAYKDIVDEVNRWIEATKLQAKIQIQTRKAAEAESLIEEKAADIAAKTAELEKFVWYDRMGRVNKGPDPNSYADRAAYNKLRREIEMDRAAIFELRKVANDANTALKNMGVTLYETFNDASGNGSTGDGGKKEGIDKVFDKYTKELKELDNKLREHAITQEEYNEEFNNLVSKVWKEAAGTGQMSIEKILEKMDKGKTLTKMEEWYKDLYENAKKAAFNATAIAAADAIQKALDDAIEEADKKLNDELEDWADRAEKVSAANLSSLLTDKPSRGKRDSTFDYKKSQGDILDERLGVDKDYINDLENAIDTIKSKYDNLADASEEVKKRLAEWQAELAKAKTEASTLEETMKIAKIQEDIEALNQSITDSVIGGIKNMASSMDRVIKGMETLKETMDDSDSTGWEKFMAVFNEMVQIMETITSAYQTLMTIQGFTNKLNQAEVALISTRIELLQKELLLRQAISAQKANEVNQTEQQVAANLAETATANAASSAKAGEAIAGATASGSKLPFPYNLAAIAAGVAAVLAALAQMSKYANGGLVGGNSFSGDKQLARVNSGEMILNRKQQANLWSIINGSGGLGNREISFKLRGTDIIGAIRNTEKRMKG